jgi:PAS domain S-box-containing protein
LTKAKPDFEQSDAPWSNQSTGVEDFWCQQALEASALEMLVAEHSQHAPEAGRSDTQPASWKLALQAARDGDWSLYHGWLRGHGARCAQLGLSVRESGEVMRSQSAHLLPALIAARAGEPERLTSAIQAMNDFNHHGLGVIADAYLAHERAELHAREDDLSTTLDSIGDAVVVTDAEGRVVRLNPVAERLTGFAIGECRGTPLAEVFRIENESTGDTVESPVTRVLREGTIVGLANHTVLLARDGTRRPIVDSGAPVRDKNGRIRGVVLVFRDVTDERRTEEALRHWERVFQHATWGVALADVKEVKFRAVNPAYAAMHGYTVEELLGAPVSTLWAAGTKADMERHAHETRDHGHLVAETTHVRKDGSTLPVEVVAATIKDESGKVAWFVANVQDITERKRLQQSRFRAVELEARNRRIEEANRMKSEFLANMSHELRTPLNSIIGFTELLHDEQVGEVAPKQKEFLADILAGGRHLLRLINDVLDLAKVEAGKMEFRPEPVDLAALVRTVVHSLRTAAVEKHLEVEVDVPLLEDVVLDPARFKQILYNYLSNALKFTPDGGRVRVRLRPDADEWFRLEVEDTGGGIPADQMSRLFTAFQQLESSSSKRHGGTGLGLALTRKLAEAQGGSVGVRPAEGGGSVFFALLPRRHTISASSSKYRSERNAVAMVLVVARDHTARNRWANVLLDAGYEVETTASLAQASRSWKEQLFDAVIVDLSLDRDELQAFSELVHLDERGRSVPLIGVGIETASAQIVLAASIDVGFEGAELLATLENAGSPPPRGRPVLVVDDDPGSLRLMEATLANLGYAAACFSDPHAALRALAKLRPAAVVIDIIMPDLDGVAFLERFRATEQHKTVPVMFWTVKDLSAEERTRLQAVADLIVQKGIGDGSRLSAALQSFLPAHARRKGR